MCACVKNISLWSKWVHTILCSVGQGPILHLACGDCSCFSNSATLLCVCTLADSLALMLIREFTEQVFSEPGSIPGGVLGAGDVTVSERRLMAEPDTYPPPSLVSSKSGTGLWSGLRKAPRKLS